MVEKEIDSCWNSSPQKTIVGPDRKTFMPTISRLNYRNTTIYYNITIVLLGTIVLLPYT